MKDGKELPHRTTAIAPVELVMLGWKLFVLPKKGHNDIILWAHNNLELWNIFLDINVIAIRRHEDAVLFKLSWPECNQMSPNVQFAGTLAQQRENLSQTAYRRRGKSEIENKYLKQELLPSEANNRKNA